MQKRHFERAARIVRDLPEYGRAEVVDAFILLFRAAPRFNEQRFRAACAPTGPARGTTLRDYQTGEAIRPATLAELAASIEATRDDGGAGVIVVDGRSCYVA